MIYNKEVRIPPSIQNNPVTGIGFRAFIFNYDITKVIIPNSVTSVGNEAFYKCTSLTSIIIPSNILQIEEYAFRYCSSLICVIFQGNIDSNRFINKAFNGLGDLRAKYLKGGIETYTRPNGKSNTWTKQ